MSDKLIIIGICGRARPGKDLCANALALYRDCHRIALADAVRDAFAGLSGITGEFHKELTEAHNFRRALQTLGTEARDEVNAPGLWTHLLLAKVHYAHKLHPRPRRAFVVPDIRFPHEESMIRYQVNRWGGCFRVAKLDRSESGVIPESDHASETSIDRVSADAHYRNNGTIADLVSWIVGYFDEVKDRRIAV